MKLNKLFATVLAVVMLAATLALAVSAGTYDATRQRYDYGTPLNLAFDADEDNIKANHGDAAAAYLSFTTVAREGSDTNKCLFIQAQGENKGAFSFTLDNSKLGTKVYIAIDMMHEDFKHTLKIFDNESPKDNEVDGAERIMNVTTDGKLVILGGALSEEGTEVQLTANQWYKIELYLDEAANTITAFVDGEKVVDKGTWEGEGFNNFHMDVKGAMADKTEKSKMYIDNLQINTYDKVPGEVEEDQGGDDAGTTNPDTADMMSLVALIAVVTVPALVVVSKKTKR